MSLNKAFKNKKIIITGHTGFKGSWLSLWLKSLGAKVIGLSIDIPSHPSHFKVLNLQKKNNTQKDRYKKLKIIEKSF